AAKIANYQMVPDLSDTAMPPRDLAGNELDVAFLMPAKQENGLVQKNAWSIGQGQELWRHRKGSPQGRSWPGRYFSRMVSQPDPGGKREPKKGPFANGRSCG